MNFPDDLPFILEYRCGKTVRITLPRRPVSFVSTSGKSDAPLVCPQIPLGCSGWRRAGESEWRLMKDLPQAWMPLLERQRPSVMDPRTKERLPIVSGATEEVEDKS